MNKKHVKYYINNVYKAYVFNDLFIVVILTRFNEISYQSFYRLDQMCAHCVLNYIHL